MRMNGLTSARSLRLGTDLVVPVPSASAMKAGKSDTALERQVARARRSGLSAARPEDEIPAGTQTGSGKTVTGGTVTVVTEGGKTKVTYGVAKGDSLWTIARRFDVRVAELKAWNEVLTSNRLKVGLALLIWPGPKADLSTAPAPSATPAATTAAPAAKVEAPKVVATKGTKHTVESGDSLWSIAQKYGASVSDLKSWNNLGTSKLKRGQVLVVAAP